MSKHADTYMLRETTADTIYDIDHCTALGPCSTRHINQTSLIVPADTICMFGSGGGGRSWYEHKTIRESAESLSCATLLAATHRLI